MGTGNPQVEAGIPLTFVARPESAQRLNRDGLHLYAHGHEDERRTINVVVVSDVAEIQQPDRRVLAVKNCALEVVLRPGRLRRDSLQRMARRGATELESLHGYFLRLAEKVGLDARYNRAPYDITREWLAQPEIRPMHESELRAKLREA